MNIRRYLRWPLMGAVLAIGFASASDSTRSKGQPGAKPLQLASAIEAMEGQPQGAASLAAIEGTVYTLKREEDKGKSESPRIFQALRKGYGLLEKEYEKALHDLRREGASKFSQDSVVLKQQILLDYRKALDSLERGSRGP